VRPGALARGLYRVPEWLFDLGLGWLFGSRFLLLHHTGRRTGLPRRAVLEVMRHDAAADRYITASAYGERSDWFRNAMANPAVEIHVGRRAVPALVRRLGAEEAEAELLDYARRHPFAFRVIGWVLGEEMSRTAEAVRALAARMPVVAFVPRDAARGANE